MKQGAKNIAKQLLKKKLIALIPAIAPFALGVLGFVVVILAVVAPVAAAVESIEQAGENTAKFFERFGGFLTGKGWNTGEEAFFKLLNDEKLGCENSKIVTATIMYYYQVSPDAVITEEDFEDVEEEIEEGETEPSDLPYGKMYPDLKKLIKKIKKDKKEPGTYEAYVKDTFLEYEPYSELLKSTPKGSDERNKLKDKIYEEILSISKSIECLSGYSYSNYSYICPGVVVTGEGTFPLEEYVAGVITNEAYLSEGFEALKAQAIAARTYVLYRTDNCTKEISNSDSAQTFSDEPAEIAINAANETAGQVLTYNDSIFSSEYDSFCYEDPDCPDAVKNTDGTYSVTYKKLPGNETHKITLNNPRLFDYIVPGEGHSRGMSQLVSYQLADEGMNYSEILQYFYSSGININNPLMFSSGGWVIRETVPTKGDQLYVSGNEVYSNVGQCVWYAKSRAMEILTELSNNDLADTEKTQKAIDSLRGTYGHARDWYKNASNSFNKIDDPNQPQAGSIIVWSGGAGHNYGHVAIIEEINQETGTITITDAYSNKRVNGEIRSCPDTWDCIVYQKKEMSLDNYFNNYIKNGSSGNYKFEGYVNFVNSNF